jgi:ribose 5-phosphate isomerase A
MLAAQQALELVRDGTAIGLGSGRAASAFVRALGERVRAGLNVRGVPTSRATAQLAQEMGIPLATLEEEPVLDITVDGADEVDPQLNLIKGYGAALVREKIVASASARLIILVGPEKLVPVLGARGIVPVEVVPFALSFCRRKLAELGLTPAPRLLDGQRVVTDNGNHILDCGVAPIEDPRGLERLIGLVPGVVGSGLFIGMADRVIIDDGDTTRVLERDARD